MGNRGALYFVWGEMDELLQRSIDSLKRHHPDLPVHVERLPNDSTYLDKVRMYEVSPFETTAYLDCDTVVMGKLDFGFDRAEQFGVACCVNESPYARRYAACLSGDTQEYNAGVVFFDKLKSKPFFEAWLACAHVIDSSSRFQTGEGMKRQRCNDQAGMAKAFEDTGYCPYTLSQNWNFRPHWQRSFVGPLKIWHDYSEVPERLVDYSEKNQENDLLDTVYLQDGDGVLDESALPTEKPKTLNIAAAMSVPRLGFQDNFFCISEALTPLGIKPVHYDGVFWGQCLERVMSEQITDPKIDWILSLDYDTVFTRRDVERLISLASRADFADAICAVQLRRKTHEILAAIKSADGKLSARVSTDELKPDLLKIDVAHFGLTLFRTSALRKMVHPWFLNVPDEKGEWGDGKQDEDIYFWRKWRATGNSLYMANHVTVGHIESMIAWPSKEMQSEFQHPCDFWSKGKPEEVWT